MLPGIVGQYLEHVLPIVFAAVLVASLYLVAEEKKQFLIGCALAAPTLFTLFDLGLVEHQFLQMPRNVLYIFFLTYVCSHILHYLLSARKVVANVIYAALCLYMILGFIWAFIYTALITLSPGSFSLETIGLSDMDRFAEMLYFSFVTITTLGYGDISPVSQLARSVTVLEAITGQIYLAVILARLVGMQISEKDSRGR